MGGQRSYLRSFLRFSLHDHCLDIVHSQCRTQKHCKSAEPTRDEDDLVVSSGRQAGGFLCGELKHSPSIIVQSVVSRNAIV